MKYNLLGKTGLRVSSICLGTMMLGNETPESESRQILDASLDAGVNFIDTADLYGNSERTIGRWLSPANRDQVVLASKGRQRVGPGVNDQGASRYHMRRALDASLKRLGVDYLDVYYLHAPDRDADLQETLRFLEDAIRGGKILYAGCSNLRAWQMAGAGFSVTQNLYNLVNRDAEVEVLPCAAHHKIGVVTYSPLARGILTGKYKPDTAFPEGSRAGRNDRRMRESELRSESIEFAAKLTEYLAETGRDAGQFALAWVLANPVVTSAIVGPRTLEQFRHNLGAMAVPVTSDDEVWIDRVVPPGTHTGKAFQDPQFPIMGRITR